MTHAARNAYGSQTGIASGTASVPFDQAGSAQRLVMKRAFAPQAIYF